MTRQVGMRGLTPGTGHVTGAGAPMRTDITDTEPIPVIRAEGQVVALVLPPSYVGTRLWSVSAGRHVRRRYGLRRAGRRAAVAVVVLAGMLLLARGAVIMVMLGRAGP